MKTFEDFVLCEMPLPKDWDRDMFKLPARYTVKNFRSALLYAREKSKYIAKGSSRAVFQITYEGRPTILKIAMNPAGLAQNEKEADTIFDGVMGRSTVIIPGIDFDEENAEPLWIHQEFARKATERDFSRILHGDVLDLVTTLQDMHNGRTDWSGRANKEFNRDHDMVHELYELWGNLGFEPEFARELYNPANWGVYQNRLVVVDLGFGSDVASDHYGWNKASPSTPRGWIRPKTTK